jgi:serralysin
MHHAEARSYYDGSHLRVCVERPLSAAAQASADDVAIELRPDNMGVALGPPVRWPSGTGFPEAGISVPGRQRMAVEKRYHWPVGQRLLVQFLDGDPALHSRVIEAAEEWTRHANISFEQIDGGDAHVRISFRQQGASWSYVGVEATVVPPTEPTMNLGGLTPETPPAELRRVVLHVVGHALGAIHEHDGTPVPWDHRVAVDYFRRALGWSPAQVQRNILARYRTMQSNLITFDPHSIMRYPVPDVLAGGAGTAWNAGLSERDKQLMAAIYPTASPEREVPVDGTMTRGVAASPGAISVFHFTVARPGVYDMVAGGTADLVLSLWGPLDEGLRAFDDNASRDDHARIVRRLKLGHYVLKVRQASGLTGGSCAVSVRRTR